MSARQVAGCLPVVDDDNPIIRGYMGILIANIDAGTLSDSIAMLERPARERHLQQQAYLTEDRCIDRSLSALASDGEATSCYAIACLIKARLAPEQRETLAALSSVSKFAKDVQLYNKLHGRSERLKARKAQQTEK